jgi:hypothetical protein
VDAGHARDRAQCPRLAQALHAATRGFESGFVQADDAAPAAAPAEKKTDGDPEQAPKKKAADIDDLLNP